jgi:hypothetical protein
VIDTVSGASVKALRVGVGSGGVAVLSDELGEDIVTVIGLPEVPAVHTSSTGVVPQRRKHPHWEGEAGGDCSPGPPHRGF